MTESPKRVIKIGFCIPSVILFLGLGFWWGVHRPLVVPTSGCCGPCRVSAPSLVMLRSIPWLNVFQLEVKVYCSFRISLVNVPPILIPSLEGFLGSFMSSRTRTSCVCSHRGELRSVSENPWRFCMSSV